MSLRHIIKAIPIHSCYIMIALCIVAIGSFEFRKLSTQIPNTLHNSIVRNDPKALEAFLAHIAQVNGILVLGTSETASGKKGHRYWEIGNYANRPVFSLAGAGRSAYSWLSLFSNYHHYLKEIDVVFYANPVYWTKKLNKFHMNYYERYHNLAIMNALSHIDIPQEATLIVNKYYQRYTSTLAGQTRLPFQWFNDSISAITKPITHNFSFYFNHYYNPPSQTEYIMVLGTDKEKEVLTQYDKKTNVPSIYKERFNTGLGPIRMRKFQTEALGDLAKLASLLDINLTVIVAPFNVKLGFAYSSDQVDKYNYIQKLMIQTLNKTNTPFINASHLNTQYGLFKDQMHLSDFIGHEYMYQLINEYFSNDTTSH